MKTIDASKYDIQKDRAFLLLAKIDGPLLKKQRMVISGLLSESADIGDPELDYNEVTALRGIENLLDSIADFCHDELGMDTIIEDCRDEDGGCGKCKKCPANEDRGDEGEREHYRPSGKFGFEDDEDAP